MDPMLSLAFTVHSSKGCYAILLGSGVSRSAGIKTGWEITLDLVRRVAQMQGDDCGDKPEGWYKAKFGGEPEYSALLDDLAKSRTERQQFLKPYFEPSDEEREQNVKVPTPAHHAIADLMRRGYIRVIVTTNFDRLMEQALEQVGIRPTVIYTPDVAKGALPLTHEHYMVFKVNGDYLDTRIKNSSIELAKYEKRINQLLDRIFDEYGLIVCGWSGEWDHALRDALLRCNTHRFWTYWTVLDSPNDLSEELIARRRAQTIQISGADEFFGALSEKVTSLDELSQPHPLSTKVAVATLKRYIAKDEHSIKLHDLVTQEAENARKTIFDPGFLARNWGSDPEALSRCLQEYESRLEVLLHLMIYGCFYGDEKHNRLWIQCLERMGSVSVKEVNSVAWEDLTYYPALLLLYGGGIASVAAGNYGLMVALQSKATIWHIDTELKAGSILLQVRKWVQLFQKVPGFSRNRTTVSDYLYCHLREPFRKIVPNERVSQR